MISRAGTAPASRRPVLYGCRPLGEGTPLIESLTGFLARLCGARNLRVRDVLDHLVRPLVPIGMLPQRRALGWLLHAGFDWFDGLRPQLAPFVSAMEHLTGLSGLGLHTFVPWAKVFSHVSSGVVGPSPKRWCARCLEQWHRQRVEPWEPLLWRSPAAAYCPLHRVPLSERCPSCARFLPPVSDLVPIGFCHRCGHLLHRGDPHLPADSSVDLHRDDSVRFEWWISLALGQMLSVQRFALSDAQPAGFAQLIASTCSPPGPGINSVSRYLGVSPPTVLTWRRGERHPPLRQFLTVCLKLGASPAQVALGPQLSFPTPWRAYTPDWRSLSVSGTPRLRAWDARLHRLRSTLDRAIEQGAFRSVDDFARAHRVSPNTVRRQFPDRYTMLLQRASALRAADRGLLEARRQAALDTVLSRSETPSVSSVSRSLGIAPDTFQRWFPEVHAALLDRAAADRAALTARCQAALDAVIDSSDVRSVNSVARSLDIPFETLRHHCPQSHARLMVLYPERRRASRRKRVESARSPTRDGRTS